MDSKNKTLVINSKNKLNGTSSNFDISFFQSVNINKYLKLVYTLIPHTNYNLSSTQNINIILSDNSNFVINFVNCYLAINDFVIYANDLLTSGNFPLKISYDKSTYKISFICTNGNNISSIVFSDKNISELLGFNNLSYNNINFPLFSSDKSVKLNLHNLIYVNFDKIENNKLISSNINMANFIIPITVDSGSYIEYNYTSNFDNVNINYLNSPVSFNKLNVILKTEDNEQYDNLNNDILLIFEFE